ANVPVGLASGPYSANLVTTNNIVTGQPLFNLANPFTAPGTPGTLALRAVSPNLRNSYAQQYTLSIEREITRNMGLRVSYVWAKEISDTDDTDDFELNNTIEDTYSRSRDRGNVYSVPRHQWLNQALYDLPFGRGRLLGGWQLNMLLNLSTGNWFTPVIAGPDP